MLKMTAISKRFGAVSVLNDVDFSVESGEIHALLGANGAGKSTLIKVLGGQYPDAAGSITLDGHAVDLTSPRSARRSGIGIVHQEFDLVPAMSVAENMFLGMERDGRQNSLLTRIDRARLSDAAAELLREFDLGLNPGSIVDSLSVGAKQITEIARVLALQSEVMIFDEPTARLGPADRDRLFAVFRTLKGRGKKLVFVTHYLDEVMTIADRASVMRDGRMVATHLVRESSVRKLSRLMVGEDVKQTKKRDNRRTGQTVLAVTGLTDPDSFHDVNFQVSAGEIVGIVGHLGSGRHELTRSILGMRWHLGEIVIEKSVSKKRSDRIGFVPEDRRLEGIFADLSVNTNIGLGFLGERSLFRRLPKRQIATVGSSITKTLQIKATGGDQKISELSGGNQQKAVFGRSMAVMPSLYIIESPTVGVDVKAAAELQVEVFRLADNGAAILLSTDDLDEAILLADRVIVMLRGRIATEFPSSSVTREQLVAAMGAG
jgi:ribose transport system ATP-binding protein